jgi:zinc protease
MSQKELSRAKQYLLGRIALDMQRFSSQAMMFGLDEMYGLGFDFSLKLADKIKSVSAEDIRRIAEKYLILDKAVLSIVHNQEMEEAFIRHAWEGKNSTLSQPKVRKSF